MKNKEGGCLIPYEQAANFVLASRRASRGAYGKWRFSGSALLQVRPGKLERFCNWSGGWRGVTRRVAFPPFSRLRHGLHRRHRAAGLFRLGLEHLPVFVPPVRLAEGLAQNGGGFREAALDLCVAGVELGAADALGPEILQSRPETGAIAVVGHLSGRAQAVEGPTSVFRSRAQLASRTRPSRSSLYLAMR